MYAHELIQSLVKEALAAAGVLHIDPKIERPAQLLHGDFSTNCAMAAGKSLNMNSRELATNIVQQITAKNNEYLEKVEAVGPGFINFYLNKKYFTHIVLDAQSKPELFGFPLERVQKRIFIEHTQPNTNKPLHVGHLRNAVLGMSLVHMLCKAFDGVESTNINNDRGIANIKGMWAFLRLGRKEGAETLNSELLKPSWQSILHECVQHPNLWLSPLEWQDEKRRGRGDYFVGHFYVLADRAGEDEHLGDQVKKDWAEMLQSWEGGDHPAHAEIRSLWKRMNQWFYEGSQATKSLLGVQFSLPEEYESELYVRGKQVIEQAVEDKTPGFVRLEDGAIQAQLQDQFHLPDKILVRRDGTAIYMTFDIELTRKRMQELHAEECVWVVGSDQDLHFKQLFAICEMLGFVPNQDRLKHFSYGMVRLPEGKLSSRKGLVVYADDILDLAVRRAEEVMRSNMDKLQLNETEQVIVAREVGVGAVKWAMLKVDPKSDIVFDLERSVSLEGNSGPYVQYAYARAQSVLRKAAEQGVSLKAESKNTHLSVFELERVLAQFPFAMHRAIAGMAPHEVCTYLFELAQAFNSFYASNPILGSGDEEVYRLQLTNAVSIALRNGLQTLGISAVERM